MPWEPEVRLSIEPARLMACGPQGKCAPTRPGGSNDSPGRFGPPMTLRLAERLGVAVRFKNCTEFCWNLDGAQRSEFDAHLGNSGAEGNLAI